MGWYHEPRYPHGEPSDGERDVWMEDAVVKFGHWDATLGDWVVDKVMCGEELIPAEVILKLDGEIVPHESTVDFGSRTSGGGAINKTFMIENPGNVPLNNISIWNNGDSHFVTSVQPPSSVGPFGSEQFCLRYILPSPEDASGVFHLESNDPNVPDYIIYVHAVTTA